MLKINQWLLNGLVVVTGSIVSINSSNAQDPLPLGHDTGSIPTNQSLVVPTDSVNGILSSDTSAFGTQGLGGSVNSTTNLDPSSINELADLLEQDLQQSLNDLEAAEKIASDQPRKFVRRRSTDCINPAIQAREDIENKLAESQKFVEQVEQFNPENNIW